MKIFIALTALLAVVIAAPQTSSKDATIVRYDTDNIGVDGYHLDLETSDGISRSEEGTIKTIGTESPVVVSGRYEWTAPDGTHYLVEFVADETGFHPTGSHLPK